MRGHTISSWEGALSLFVVTSEAVNPALHQNQSELGILVLPVPLQMLPDCDGLLDQMV